MYKMIRNKKMILIAGQKNLLHCGLFHLTEEICLKRNLTAYYVEDHDAFKAKHNNCECNYQLAILCLECDVFFPRWFSMLLSVLKMTNGNLLIFKDAREALNKRRKSILARVCSLEQILNTSMPVSYISYIIETYLDRDQTFFGCSRVTLREISVLEGYLSGVDAACHSSSLGIDIKTLYQHRKNCANKLGVRNLKDLLRL